MLECRIYPAAELFAYLHTNDKEATNRKLSRYNVDYFANGWGSSLSYNITAIHDPFRLYCVFDLGYDPHTDFRKLMEFMFYLLGDEEFNWRPMEMMERYMRERGHTISRQSIAKYLARMQQIGLVGLWGDAVYYRVWRDENDQEQYDIVSKEEYCHAWRMYWDKRNNEGWDSAQAFAYVYAGFGGVPRKQPRVEQNGIYGKELDFLLDLVKQEFMNAAPVRYSWQK